jgi:hypothetical protein
MEQYLPDASSIVVKISGYENPDIDKKYYEEDWITFILNDYAVEFENGLYSYDLDCLYDKPNLYNLATKAYRNMAVSAVLEKIAKELNLKTDIDSAKDIQTWLRTNDNLIDFIGDCVAYSYIDNSSGMLWQIGRDNTLRLKNLANIEVNKEPKWAFVKDNDAKENEVLYMQMSHEDNAMTPIAGEIILIVRAGVVDTVATTSTAGGSGSAVINSISQYQLDYVKKNVL